MYSLNAFGDMILDRVRIDAYSRALRAAVRPGSVVLDIGTGPGYFALLAHRFGARRVIAVEPDNVIQVAREIAAANGCLDAIEFHQTVSTELQLDEPVDVIISDLRGVLPLLQQHIPSIVDARKRLLAPDGVLIPRRDTLHASVLEAPTAYSQVVSPWSERPEDLDLGPAKRWMANQWRKFVALDSQLLCTPVQIGELDYRKIEDRDFHGAARLRASRDGTAHGIVIWFDAELADGIGFSNAPAPSGSPRAIYGCGFFPFPEPVPLQAGDVVDILVDANLVNDDYIWRWATSVLNQSDSDREKARFRQSSIAGEPLSPEHMRKRAASYQPELNDFGRTDHAILSAMGSGLSLEEIAKRIASERPDRFASWQDALGRVGEISLRYSR
jgi:protein arginine N-methyltransferase 1